MKVALVQMYANADKEANIHRALGFVKKAVARNAQFILLPEVFNYRGPALDSSKIDSIAEAIPGESIKPFMEVAKTNGVFILAGSIYEKISDSTKVHNTSILIDDKGEIQAEYRKMHLFDAIVGDVPVKESDRYLAGDKPVLTDVREFKVGMSICFDLRFPELYRHYSAMGAQVLCIPSSFTRLTGLAHWEVLLRARAIENLGYVLAPNQVGIDGDGIQSYGNSLVINPWGEIIARASDDVEEIIFADISEEEIKSARRKLPLLL